MALNLYDTKKSQCQQGARMSNESNWKSIGEPLSVACNFSGQPLESIAPVDQVQVADALQGALVCSPLAAGNADKSIIVPFYLFQKTVG